MSGEPTTSAHAFEAAGLLDGLEGEAREARLKLLARLIADGATRDELRDAAREQRLVLLPVERALAMPGPRFTLGEVAADTGLGDDFLAALVRALGLPLPAPDARELFAAHLQAARTIATFRAAGIDDHALLEVARVLGHSVAQLVTATGGLLAETFIMPGASEYETALSLERAARALNPALECVLVDVLRAHELAQLRHDVLDIAGIAAGHVPGSSTTYVCFADLVGFTALGEGIDADRLGVVAGRLTALVTDRVRPPVRLVKMIGDAAMLVSPEPGPLLSLALELVSAAQAQGDDFPVLRAGIACGSALPRGGDWYGQPVNLASRVTQIARPSSVLVTAAVHDAVGDGAFRWSRVPGRRNLKGVQGDVELWRARRAAVT